MYSEDLAVLMASAEYSWLSPRWSVPGRCAVVIGLRLIQDDTSDIGPNHHPDSGLILVDEFCPSHTTADTCPLDMLP